MVLVTVIILIISASETTKPSPAGSQRDFIGHITEDSLTTCLSMAISPVFLVCLCVQVFTKSGGEEQLLRRALDLKRSLEATLQKHKELHIDYKARVRKVVSYS